uniref:NADH-ubiquinone oxidoreductase chain 3 n=1 Tax=Imatidium capense TaxID=294609 RepID=U3L047_9CUCU|nr:NADH dehydrogenase subunit 3 [Imatidium capense]
MIFTLMYLIITLLIVLMLILVLMNFISMKTFSDKEKNSPFECGFDPLSKPRLPFSIQFFLIAIIFLIFDIEIALILPIIKILNFKNLINLSVLMNFFIIILIGGLFHEWNQGALKWSF